MMTASSATKSTYLPENESLYDSRQDLRAQRLYYQTETHARRRPADLHQHSAAAFARQGRW